MQLLRSLSIENYRRFERYTLDGLEQVNLLVGRNGCGKTSILEALHLLGRGGDPSSLKEIAYSRRQNLPRGTDGEGQEPSAPAPSWEVASLFHGYHLAPGTCFRLFPEPDDELRPLTIRVVLPKELETEWSPGVTATLAIRVETAGATAREAPRGAFLSANGSILGLTVVESHPLTFPISARGTPIVSEFITPRSCEPFSLSSLWSAAEGLPHVNSFTSQVVGWPEGNEDSRISQVIEMLRIAEPDVEHVTPSQDCDHVHGVDTSFRVFMTNRKSPVPLENLGDGVFQLLKLALSLAQTEKGLLLVDEIDTGLHYSVMGDMWRQVVETAVQTDVQVFATTHSLDCVRGLAWLCDSYPDLGAEVSLQKIVPNLDQSVTVDAEGIKIAMAHEIEVR